MELREPLLGVAVGRKGCGKTYTTNDLIQKYVRGDIQRGIPPRRVLILDVNDEFEKVPALRLSDVMKFSVHPIIEVRRIRPFKPNGEKMTINDILDALHDILRKFRNGLLLLEDINRYVSDNLPNDIIGAICTNRHSDMDIIMHFQSIGRITPKIWANLNWIRFHKNTESVDRHRNKFEDKYEMLKLIEMYIDNEIDAGNERCYCYADIQMMKINRIDIKKMDKVIEEYIADNQKRLINPLISRKDFGTGKKMHTAQTAFNFQKERIKKNYIYQK